MVNDGYENVVNVDIPSSVVIEAMQTKYSNLQQLKLKFGSEGSCEQPGRELTNPVPLEESGSSVEDVLGKNPDVHYNYACTKEAKAKE